MTDAQINHLMRQIAYSYERLARDLAAELIGNGDPWTLAGTSRLRM
jgi:hypothetical protein